MGSFKQHVGLINRAKCVLHCKFDYYFLKKKFEILTSSTGFEEKKDL